MAPRAGLPRSTALPNELLAVETRFGLEGITRVPLSAMDGMVALGETPAVLAKETVVDLIPYLTSTGGYVLDKVEGLTAR